MLKVRSELNINGVVEISDHGNVDMSAFLELLHTEPEKLSEGPPNMNEEGGCDEKDDYVPEVTAGKYFTLKKLLEIFHDIEHAKEKMLEVDPDLERNMTTSPRCRKDV